MYDKGILSEKVAKDIQQMITKNDLQPGDKLPNEHEMMQLVNVGRSTIREAIKILVASGMLEVKRGRGTFVGMNPGVGKDPLGVQYMDDENLLIHLFEMRLMLEPKVIELAIERGTKEDLLCIQKAFEHLETSIISGEDHSEDDTDFHTAIAEATHNPIMKRIIPIINQGIVEGYSKTKDRPFVNAVVRQQHANIMDAIMAKDKVAANDAMTEHIQYGLDRCKEF